MGFDFETLVILLVLAFILFGPEKLPEYAATLGKFVAKLRQATTEMTRQYQNPFQYPPEPSTEKSPELPLAPALTMTQSPSPESASFCPYCQGKVGQGFTFCPQCGHRLMEDHYPPPPPSPVQAPPSEPAPRSDSPSQSEPAQPVYPLVRLLRQDEIDRALTIINQAALAYKGVIPADCWQEPYMPEEELRAEIAAGVDFFCCAAAEGLLGVMGRQNLGEVTLIRHAYVDPQGQRQGVGSRLLSLILEETPGPVLVGTWAAAWWAIRFYEKHGFRLVTQEEKDRLLRTYWNISPRQVETSVVLADPKWLSLQGSGIRGRGSEAKW
jgi:Sec-independent protein translocase protein TatA/GNAT superfamily N-acetyltransferase